METAANNIRVVIEEAAEFHARVLRNTPEVLAKLGRFADFHLIFDHQESCNLVISTSAILDDNQSR